MNQMKDIYSRITSKIVADLEQGVRPWFTPWNAEHAASKITRPLRHNGIPYKGINVVMLWSASMTKGYACPLWLTFKQAIDLGGHVRKGENGELVVYADKITRTEADDKGEEQVRQIPLLKGYTVFNAEQCDDLPAHYYAPHRSSAGWSRPTRVVPSSGPADQEAPPGIRRGFPCSNNKMNGDNHEQTANHHRHRQGRLPRQRLAERSRACAGAACGATGHQSQPRHDRHASRLNREFGCKRWGDASYAAEELVALS